MKPKNWRIVMAEAAVLADGLGAALAERGVPECCWPPREAMVAEMLPAALGLFRARRAAAVSAMVLGEMEAAAAALPARYADLLAAVMAPGVREAAA